MDESQQGLSQRNKPVSMLLLPKVKDADGAAVEGRGVEELPNVNVWAVPFDAAASVLCFV